MPPSQVEADLLSLLKAMRTGVVVSTSASKSDIGAALTSMEMKLAELSKKLAQCGVFARLLSQDGIDLVCFEIMVSKNLSHV